MRPGRGGLNISPKGAGGQPLPFAIPNQPERLALSCFQQQGYGRLGTGQRSPAQVWGAEVSTWPVSCFPAKHPWTQSSRVQVVNRCIKQPCPFKALQTIGRRACRPSGPLFGNVCAHNKPDRQRFITVFISWAWFGLLLFPHGPPPRHPTSSPPHPRPTPQFQIYGEWEGQGLREGQELRDPQGGRELGVGLEQGWEGNQELWKVDWPEVHQLQRKD